MKTVLVLCAGLAALGIGYHFDTLSKVRTSEAMSQTQARVPESYGLHVLGKAAVCRVTKGRRLAAGVVEIALSPGCADAPAGLEDAALWREDGAGDVILAAADGRPLVRFAIGDGVAYESYRPRLPLMSLAVER